MALIDVFCNCDDGHRQNRLRFLQSLSLRTDPLHEVEQLVVTYERELSEGRLSALDLVQSSCLSEIAMCWLFLLNTLELSSKEWLSTDKGMWLSAA